MEGRKWEELNMDCLVNVLGRLGMESLLIDIPFVCKSWYKATLSPLCWQRLEFDDTGYINRSSGSSGLLNFSSCCTESIKLVINRSGGSAVLVHLPNYCMEEALVCVAEQCPALKNLKLPDECWDDNGMSLVPSLISKWKNLEMLRLGSCINMEAILTQVSLHCENFVGLGISEPYIGEDETNAIVTLLPNIMYLFLRHATLERANLVTILKGCKKLVHFDVRNSKGFKGDDEILNLASHIPTFKYKGSRLFEECWSEEDDISYYDPEPYDTSLVEPFMHIVFASL